MECVPSILGFSILALLVTLRILREREKRDRAILKWFVADEKPRRRECSD